MSTEFGNAESALQTRRFVVRAFTQALFLPLVVGPFLFVPAGTLAWPMGWVVLVIFVAGNLGLSLLAAFREPDLAEERLTPAAGAKNWDRFLTSATNLLLIAGRSLKKSGLQ